MLKTSEDYLSRLIALMPQGQAWNYEKDSNLSKVLQCLSEELSLIDERIDDLLKEMTPLQSAELFIEWVKTISPRTSLEDFENKEKDIRTLLLTKLRQPRGSSVQYFQNIVKSFDPQNQIEEYRAFTAGSRVGRSLTNTKWKFCFGVRGPKRDPLLESLLQALKPAHTNVCFWNKGS